MYRPRLIPVLLLRNGGLVKSVNFKKHSYIGDPLNAVNIFNDLEADELVFLDIDATKEKRSVNIDLIKKIGEEANMPFSVGGGVNTIEQITNIIQAGAERIILGSIAVNNPLFVEEACNRFGSSTIAVCVDYKKDFWGKQLVWTNNGGQKHKVNPLEFALKMEQCGVGEVIIQSIEKDGMMNGFDLSTIKHISDAIKISVVGLGGAGSLNHFKELFDYVSLSGIASGSTFIYKNEMRGVLINYPKNKVEKEFIWKQ